MVESGNQKSGDKAAQRGDIVRTFARKSSLALLLFVAVGVGVALDVGCVETAECDQSILCQDESQVCFNYECLQECSDDSDCASNETCTSCETSDACFGAMTRACVVQDQ